MKRENAKTCGDCKHYRWPFPGMTTIPKRASSGTAIAVGQCVAPVPMWAFFSQSAKTLACTPAINCSAFDEAQGEGK